MKLARFFELAIAAGSAADPRGSQAAGSYGDSAILYGDGKLEVKAILAGIDIDVQELLLADRMRSRRRVDCVLSHHPSGTAVRGLLKVMELQAVLLEKAGLDRKSAEQFLEERRAEVERKFMPQNLTRAVDAARLLDIPFVCVHTPADNCASRYISRLLSRISPRNVNGVLSALMSVPEYQAAAKEGAGPRLVLGSGERPAGKILVEMTGGTSGPRDVYGLLRKAGVGTLVSMHISEEHLKKIRACGLNAIVAGHMSSDTLGLNLALDKIEKEEPLEIICCSGFRRFRH